MFRSDTISSALHVYSGMLGFNGSTNNKFEWVVIQSSHNTFWQTLLIALIIAIKGRNLNGLFMNGYASLQTNRHKLFLAVCSGVLLCISLLSLNKISYFLYFQF
jgi:hypothetical protein